jgi:competence ComEA-like helix-hairpin-helix protein
MANDRRKGLVVLLLILTGGIIWFTYTPKQKGKQTIKPITPVAGNDSLGINRIEQIDLNTCTAEELDALPGIGATISKRILEYREKSGGFRHLDEVKAIPGLAKIWAQAAPYFRLENSYNPDNTYKTETNPSSGKTLLDLNQISEADLQALNILPEDLAHRLIRYRDACKGFKSFDHVARTHGLTPVFLDRIKQHFYVNPPFTSKKNIQPIDINRADSAQLEALPGIGEKLSARIVKYRNRLGFFHSLEQLKEVYGLKSEFLEKMLPHVYVNNDLSAYPHIRLNEVTVSELQKHPYLSDWRIARQIINHRKKIGRYESWKDLYQVSDLDSLTIERIAPYLKIE